MKLFDTHGHPHFNAYKDDMDAVIQRSLKKCDYINLVGTQRETSRRAVEVAEKFSGCYATIGMHPEHLFNDFHDENEVKEMTREEFDYGFYKKLAENPKVIGIGECGLDLYRLPEGLNMEEVLAKQEELFRQHIKLAKETNLPLVIHSRDAHPHLIRILSDVGNNSSPVRGTMHCYTGNWEYAQKYLEMGLYLGFTGVITFPPKKKNPEEQAGLLEVVKNIPEDRMLIETDCPYLAPLPYRGQRGEPWMVEEVAKKIAEIRGMTLENVIQITTENGLRLFNRIEK